jgi:metal-responsive CopG/Arc/MetJ family transcriptional regulator
MLNAEELAVLDAWRFEKRMSSRSDAVRELLRRGLAATGDGTAGGARSVDFGVLGSAKRLKALCHFCGREVSASMFKPRLAG